MKLRVAVVGAGSHSQGHGEALRLLRIEHPDDLDLCAVCDLRSEAAEAYRRSYGFRAAYTSMDEMLRREEPEVLLAVTPIPLTAAMAHRLLELPMTLLIEKPPGATSADTRRLLERARACGSSHMLSFNRRFSPAFLRYRAWVREGEGREPHLIRASMLRSRRYEPDFTVGTGIHLIDATLSVLGRPVEVDSTLVSSGTEGCVHVGARIRGQQGRIAQVLIAPNAGVVEEVYELVGEGTLARVDTMGCTLTIWAEGECVLQWSAAADDPAVLRDGTLDETRALLDTARGSPPGHAPDLSDGLVAMLTAEAVARGGRQVIESVSDGEG